MLTQRAEYHLLLLEVIIQRIALFPQPHDDTQPLTLLSEEKLIMPILYLQHEKVKNQSLFLPREQQTLHQVL